MLDIRKNIKKYILRKMNANYYCYCQCCDLETKVLNSRALEFILLRSSSQSETLVPRSQFQSQYLAVKVFVLVSRTKWQGLIHSRMQQILRKCSEYSKKWIIGTALIRAHNNEQQFEQLYNCFNVGSFRKKMYCIIGFKLVCIFLFYANIDTSSKVSVSGLRT